MGRGKPGSFEEAYYEEMERADEFFFKWLAARNLLTTEQQKQAEADYEAERAASAKRLADYEAFRNSPEGFRLALMVDKAAREAHKRFYATDPWGLKK